MQDVTKLCIVEKLIESARQSNVQKAQLYGFRFHTATNFEETTPCQV